MGKRQKPEKQQKMTKSVTDLFSAGAQQPARCWDNHLPVTYSRRVKNLRNPWPTRKVRNYFSCQ